MTGTTVFSMLCAFLAAYIILWRIAYLCTEGLERYKAVKKALAEAAFILALMLVLKYAFFLLFQPV